MSKICPKVIVTGSVYKKSPHHCGPKSMKKLCKRKQSQYKGKKLFLNNKFILKKPALLCGL